jgi:subtilisin family serine protease
MRPTGSSIFRGVILIALLLSGSAGQLQAALPEPSLQAALQAAAPEEEVRVIVEFAQRPDLEPLRRMPRLQRRALIAREMKAAAERDQRGVQSLLQRRGVKRIRHLWMINSLALQAPPEVIRELAAHPDVQRLTLDRKFAAADILLQSFPPPEANLGSIRAGDLWLQGDYGQGAVVAVMDTGADAAHPDLAGTWRGGTNSWFDPFGVHPAPFDGDGHGTTVLGIMVGGGAGGTTIGAAPAATWIAARIFDDGGITFDSVIHQVFQWFLDPDSNTATDDAPDVVNASWGFQNLAGLCDATFQPDIEALDAAGIAVVFAAGNTGPRAATSISPANNTGAVAVGSIDGAKVVDPTSSRGPSACDGRIYPDVVAPGDGIRTTDLSFGGFPTYTSGTGTSYSAPHVSGVLALLRSAFPDATLDQLKSAMAASAADLGAAGPDDVYGHGLVDAAAAYAALGAPCIRPQVGFTAVPFPASAGQEITFTSSVSGGTPPYSYAWDFNGDGTPDCTEAVCSHVFPSAYSGSVALSVIDAGGCSSSVVVADGWAACASISASFTIGPTAPVAGRTVTFSSQVSGGTAPYSYEWDLDGDGRTDCTTAACTTTYPAAFNGNAVLRVADRFGCRADAIIVPVTVAAAPRSSSSGGGGGGCFVSAAATEPTGLLPCAVLVAFLSAAACFRRRQNNRKGRGHILTFDFSS